MHMRNNFFCKFQLNAPLKMHSHMLHQCVTRFCMYFFPPLPSSSTCWYYEDPNIPMEFFQPSGHVHKGIPWFIFSIEAYIGCRRHCFTFSTQDLTNHCQVFKTECFTSPWSRATVSEIAHSEPKIPMENELWKSFLLEQLLNSEIGRWACPCRVFTKSFCSAEPFPMYLAPDIQSINLGKHVKVHSWWEKCLERISKHFTNNGNICIGLSKLPTICFISGLWGFPS